MFGESGEEFHGYNEKDFSDKDVKDLNEMWEIDHFVSIGRGIMQGITIGLNKDYDFTIDNRCFGKETSM